MNCKNCGFPLNGNQTCPSCGIVNENNNIQPEQITQTDTSAIPFTSEPETQNVEQPSTPVVPVTPEITPIQTNPNVSYEPKKKNKTLIIILIIIGVLAIGGGIFVGIKFLLPKGGSSGTTTSNVGNSCGKSNPDHFIVKEVMGKQVLWRLTDLGAEQESIVIPSGIDKFVGAHFTMGTSVKHVCFESDDDIELMGAFNDSENLETIILPKNLTTDFSMNNCPKLKEITIPAGVEQIRSLAFSNDVSLKKVVFAGDTKEIGIGAFLNCESLETIELPDSVEKIYDEAFKGCKSLKSITLPKNLNFINGYTLFDDSGIETVIVPKEVELEYWHKPSPIKLPNATVKVYEGSWMDEHFYEVFSQDTKKEYIK